MASDILKGPKRKTSTDPASTTSSNYGNGGKIEPKKATLTFSAHYQTSKNPPKASELKHNSDCDNEMATTSEMMMPNSDYKSTSDDVLPHVEPKLHSEIKERKQHVRVDVIK